MPVFRAQKTDLLRGTLDLLILRTLALQPLHGVAIADRIAQVTQGTFHVMPGTLFPALHRLEQAGWTAGQWTATAEGRRVRTYELTAAGRTQLVEEERAWERVVAAMTRVLRST
jgi:PadR family transcriptional regulator PadR